MRQVTSGDAIQNAASMLRYERQKGVICDETGPSKPKIRVAF